MKGLKAIKSFLQRYSDERTIECLYENEMADVSREEILKINSEDDVVKIDLIQNEKEPVMQVPFKRLKIVSDTIIWSD